MKVFALYYKVRSNRLERWDDITELEPVDMFPSHVQALQTMRRMKKRNPSNLIKYVIQEEEM